MKITGTSRAVRQQADNPLARLYPDHAIVRDPASHLHYKCLCGQTVDSMDADVQRRALGKHVLANTKAAA